MDEIQTFQTRIRVDPHWSVSPLWSPIRHFYTKTHRPWRYRIRSSETSISGRCPVAIINISDSVENDPCDPPSNFIVGLCSPEDTKLTVYLYLSSVCLGLCARRQYAPAVSNAMVRDAFQSIGDATGTWIVSIRVTRSAAASVESTTAMARTAQSPMVPRPFNRSSPADPGDDRKSSTAKV